MSYLRIEEVAALLGVSDDTVRAWIEQGKLTAIRSGHGPHWVSGRELAQLLRSAADAAEPGGPAAARNRMRGIITRVSTDRVMAQVELRAGPFRLVSLLNTESAHELGLVVGSVAVASVPAAHVVLDHTER
ncbi:helix-turn-helix domain-containing protein [Nocardia sp. NPDC050712]|uniref:TOBE domain-containing protein n=1 Tax=Nocardia sp. NPDC050712 TaxID=3155518 RepID=UPI0033E30A79